MALLGMMKLMSERYTVKIVTLLAFGMIFLGVFAGTTTTINSGQGIKIGAGSATFLACDDDVNITTLTYNDGNKVYLQGFQYDNVSKSACVNFDFDTRFVSNNGELLKLFATTSVFSESNLTRVFATSSSSEWQLGLGAIPTSEVTVTQLSSSSFKVIFTNPIAVISDIGKIVMAQMLHLPNFTYTSNYLTFTSTGNKQWGQIATPDNGAYIYVIDFPNAAYLDSSTGCIHKSSQILTSFSGVTLDSITALPCGSGGNYWYSVATSGSGQYVAAAGTSSRVYFSTDFGSTWDSKTSTTYNTLGGTTNGSLSMSTDGQVVCMIAGSFIANIWKNGSFFNKTDSRTAYITSSGAAISKCIVSPDGSKILISNSQGVRKYSVASLSGNVGALTSTTALDGSDRATALATSTDGRYIAYVRNSNSASLVVRVSNDYGATFTSATGVPAQLNSKTMVSDHMKMSRNGQIIAVALYDTGSQNGGVYISSDGGATFTATTLTGLYANHLTASADLSRIFSDDTLGYNKIYMINSV